MRKCVIFDLDGTLTKSEEGIWNSVRYAADKLGFAEPDADTLRKFIGPPLAWSFETYMGMTPAQADDAVRAYRERYTTVGLFENRVFPGIRRLLRTLRAEGWYVAVATGKPQTSAERIIAHFGLTPYFAKVVGPDDATKKAQKDELISRALPEAWDEAWMVGDRCFDVDGGKAVGVHTIGVGYGYGTEEELRSAGCDVYCPTVQSLIEALCPGAKPPRGAFVTMEGMDGCGKTTQMAYLLDALDRWGYEVRRTREPGGCAISEKIRGVLLDNSNAAMTDTTEALLYAAARCQHVAEVIRPAVAAGQVVLCDRFVDSSVAYQGGGRCLGVETVEAINRFALDGMKPDITVYLDIDRATAQRRRAAASELDRMEAETDAFRRRTEEAYRALIAREPERFIVVDATPAPEKIAQLVAERVLNSLMEAEK